jgi:hypothetical protein
MANTPKQVRFTAKRHAEASRKNDAFGKLGGKTTQSVKAWPKMSWDENTRNSEYVGKYAGRNSEFNSGRK